MSRVLVLVLAVALSRGINSQFTAEFNKTLEAVFGTEDKPFNFVESTSSTTTTTTTTTTTQRIVTATGDLDLTEKGGSDPPGAETGGVCETENSENGICVLYYQCDSETRQLIKDGATLIDIRIKDRPCKNYFDVCCLDGQVNKTEIPPPPQVTVGCGYANPGAFSFRSTGEEGIAEYGEFPFMIALLKKTSDTAEWLQSNYLGGGSLIHPSVVLTAAHKLEGTAATAITARAGEWDTQNEGEQYPYQERDGRKKVVHPDFYRPAMLNAVGLLFLQAPFDLTNAPHMGLACLGHALPPADTRCFSMGWGKDDFKAEGKYAVVLKKIDMPLVERTKCRNILRGTRLGSYFQLHPSLICAGGEKGKDTCRGDGGSPLVCPIGKPEDMRFAQFGAVAWGIGCGTEVPGVYVHMTSFRKWIVDKVKEEQLDPNVFDFQE